MMRKLKDLWFRGLYRVLSGFAFNRITVTGQKSDGNGPALYVCLHRNGALDGAVYQRVAPKAKMTLSSQLRRKAWMRAIFDGIEILRPQDVAKDGARVNNSESFAKAASYLAQGGELFFFPEGTSELGARHLKFRTGVAKLIRTTLEQVPSLKVVPLAAHYEDATTWQSNVDVRVGDALEFEGMPAVPDIMARLTRALEDIGLDCDTLKERQSVEALAYAATLGNRDIPYSKALKALSDASETFNMKLAMARAAGGPLQHQGVPLAPVKHVWPYLLALAALFPFQLFVMGLNCVPYLMMEKLVDRLADAPNVRSLWRALTGVALLFGWGGLVITPLLALWNWPLVFVYWLACVLQVKTLYRTKKVLVTVANDFAMSTDPAGIGRGALLELHKELAAYVRGKL
jgi:1-acyl-sn-glycerol-3-phosphate acyltransferase